VPPAPESAHTIAPFSRPEAGARPLTWQFAMLRRTGKRRCQLEVAPASLLKRGKRQVIKAAPLLALGSLGGAGWELVAIRGKRFYLKRPAAAAATK
jgi:hypothetical protein